MVIIHGKKSKSTLATNKVYKYRFFMEYYLFDLNPSEKDGLLKVLCDGVFEDKELRNQLENPTNKPVQIEGGKLGPILRALDAAIAYNELICGGWMVAKDYRKTKAVLANKARVKFRPISPETN